MQSGMIGTLRALYEIFPLFTNTGWGENTNLAFLKKHMGATFEERPQPWISSINTDDIHSGDFLAISKIRGLWGGFETLEKWVTGSFAGHSAVFLRDSEGKLWVAESGHDNEKVRTDRSLIFLFGLQNLQLRYLCMLYLHEYSILVIYFMVKMIKYWKWELNCVFVFYSRLFICIIDHAYI